MDNISIDENIAYHKELVSLYEQEKEAILERIEYLIKYSENEETSKGTPFRHSTEINLEIIGLKQRLLDVEQSIKTQDTWMKELKERKQYEEKAKKNKKEAKIVNIKGGNYNAFL